MDAFRVYRQLIDDYRSFTEGFVDIRDPRLGAAIKQAPLCCQRVVESVTELEVFRAE